MAKPSISDIRVAIGGKEYKVNNQGRAIGLEFGAFLSALESGVTYKCVAHGIYGEWRKVKRHVESHDTFALSAQEPHAHTSSLSTAH